MASSPSLRRSGREAALALLLVAPALVLFLLFVVIPVIQAGYYSFFNWNGIGPATNFLGFGNFRRMFSDRVFHTALRNTLLVIGVSIVIQLPLAFFLALLVGRKRTPGESVFRSVYFFPYVLAEIVTGIIWRFIYHPRFGVPTVLASAFSGVQTQVGILGDPDIAFFGVLGVIVWKYLGFHMILYIAGLQGVSKDLEDAAVVDGANNVQIVRHVIIPSIRNTIIISFFLSVIGSFNVFDVVWALGQGGPVHSTETLVTYLYNFGFRRFAFGYGSAVAVVIFGLCFIFNFFYQRYVVRSQANG
ncbi:MAG: carbohydrate ABC transporter permease [Spirochaetota bacterium]